MRTYVTKILGCYWNCLWMYMDSGTILVGFFHVFSCCSYNCMKIRLWFLFTNIVIVIIFICILLILMHIGIGLCIDDWRRCCSTGTSGGHEDTPVIWLGQEVTERFIAFHWWSRCIFVRVSCHFFFLLNFFW